MKAQVFLELVGAARYEAINFYAKRQTYPIEAKKHLIKARELEKRIDAVVKEGRLEPDIVTTVEIASAYEERQLRLHLEDERDAGEADRMEEDDEDIEEDHD